MQNQRLYMIKITICSPRKPSKKNVEFLCLCNLVPNKIKWSIQFNQITVQDQKDIQFVYFKIKRGKKKKKKKKEEEESSLQLLSEKSKYKKLKKKWILNF